MYEYLDYLALITISALFVIYAYVKGKIDKGAVFGSALIGILAIIAFGYFFTAVIVFFVLGTSITKYKEGEKEKLGIAEGIRTIKNVFGNGGAAALFSAASIVTHDPVFLVGYLASIATACADTFSTEIGQTYKRPRLITNLQEVAPGTNGGVSIIGFAGSILGAVLVSSLALIIANDFMMFAVCAISAFAGGVFDSVLGATIEKRGAADKHTVNFLATSFGGIAGMLLWAFF